MFIEIQILVCYFEAGLEKVHRHVQDAVKKGMRR